MAKLIPEFQKRNVVVAALSCNSVDSHKEWIKDIQVIESPLQYIIVHSNITVHSSLNKVISVLL